MAAVVERTGSLPGPRESLNSIVFLSFYRGDLDGIVDMLRNEKPVMFNCSPENRVAQITTGPEPVGEEEGKHIAFFFSRVKQASKKRAPGKQAEKPATRKKSEK